MKLLKEIEGYLFARGEYAHYYWNGWRKEPKKWRFSEIYGDEPAEEGKG